MRLHGVRALERGGSGSGSSALGEGQRDATAATLSGRDGQATTVKLDDAFRREKSDARCESSRPVAPT